MEWLFQNDFLFGYDILNRIPHALDPVMAYIMQGITTLGNELFYTLAIPIIYWVYDKNFAYKVAGFFLLCAFINEGIKNIFNNPRPFQPEAKPELMDADLYQMALNINEESPGFPSGHTQNSVVFWGVMAATVKKTWFTTVCISLILLIPFSRMYLGVHFPGDVLGGYVFGGLLLLLLFTPYFRDIRQFHNNLLVIILFSLFLFLSIGGETIPYIGVILDRTNVKILGVISGLILGIFLDKTMMLNFEPRNTLIKQVLKVLIGLAGVVLINFGLKILLETLYSEWDSFGRFLYFLRNCTLGVWIIFLAPFIFQRIPYLKKEEGEME